MRNVRQLIIVLGLLLPVTSLAAAPKTTPTDRCVVNSPYGGTPLNTFVFQDVPPLTPGRSIPLKGIFFTSALKPSAFEGAAMMASDGTVRLGLFVHSSADSTNDFTVSAVTDTTFAGNLKFDSDGDYRTEGTLVTTAVSCDTIAIP
jgi:hypothetical protein